MTKISLLKIVVVAKLLALLKELTEDQELVLKLYFSTAVVLPDIIYASSLYDTLQGFMWILLVSLSFFVEVPSKRMLH